MASETEFFEKPVEINSTAVVTAPEHNIKNMSIRALLAIIITGTGCTGYLSSLFIPGVVLDRDFYMLWLAVITFYYAKPSAPPNPTTSTTTSTTVSKTNNAVPVVPIPNP